MSGYCVWFCKPVLPYLPIFTTPTFSG
jgi:hypothetical protein